MSPGRKLLFTLIMLFFAGLLAEVFSFGLLQFEAWRRPYKFRHDAAYYLDPMPADWAAKFYAKGYHPVLGWDGPRYASAGKDLNPTASRDGTKSGGKNKKQKKRQQKTFGLGYDAEGARVNPDFADGAPAIAAYGDSFTKGAEVAWNETWAYYLSEMLGRYVANYGVGGYGPDQATLKFRLHPAEAPKPKIAILGIFEENINRVVNRYRSYYQEDSPSFLAFKPRFLPSQDDGPGGGPDGSRLLPTPLSEATEDPKQLAEAVVAARDHDTFWDRKVEFGFPYSLALGKLALLALGKASGKALPLGSFSGDLWEAPRATATMDAVIEAFVAEAEARGIQPVILFLPRIRHQTAEDRDNWAPNYRGYRDALETRYENQGLIVLDLADAAFQPEDMHVRPFDGHYSPYGNQVVARFLFDRLELGSQAIE